MDRLLTAYTLMASQAQENEKYRYGEDLHSALENNMYPDVLDFIWERFLSTRDPEIDFLTEINTIFTVYVINMFGDCHEDGSSMTKNIQWFMSKGLPLNYRDEDGETIFHRIVHTIINRTHFVKHEEDCDSNNSHTWVIESLVELGFDQNIPNNNNEIPLMILRNYLSTAPSATHYHDYHNQTKYWKLVERFVSVMEKSAILENRQLKDRCQEMEKRLNEMMNYMNDLSITNPDRQRKKPKNSSNSFLTDDQTQ